MFIFIVLVYFSFLIIIWGFCIIYFDHHYIFVTKNGLESNYLTVLLCVLSYVANVKQWFCWIKLILEKSGPGKYVVYTFGLDHLLCLNLFTYCFWADYKIMHKNSAGLIIYYECSRKQLVNGLHFYIDFVSPKH